MDYNISHLEVQDIDHLGIVAAIVDEISLVEELDRLLGIHSQEHLSSGQLIKAMILNGLGFVSAPLYLFQEFFEGKATEHLIAEGVKPEHLNDDKLGRVLDKLFAADLTKVFVSVAMKAASRYNLKLNDSSSVHLDSSSFHVHGNYYPSERQEEPQEAAISITHGYSREQRPDLKQFLIDLIASADGDVPLFCRIAGGNEADKAVFAKLIKDFRSQVDLDVLFVADSALYTKHSLKQMSDLKWLTRVPLTLTEAKRVLSEIEEDAFEESTLSGYRIAEVESNYAGIAQRWLIVHSDERQQAANEQLERRLLNSEKQLKKQLNKLKKKDFECEADALKAASSFAKELRYHKLAQLSVTSRVSHDKPGKPARNASPQRKVYSLKATLERDEAAIAQARKRSGRFILATNVVVELEEEDKSYTKEELLKEYKAQQSAERGFRFLRDPLFFTSSVFVKTPQRVAAIAMVEGAMPVGVYLGPTSAKRST